MDGWSKEAIDYKPPMWERVLWYVFIHGIGLALGASFQRILTH